MNFDLYLNNRRVLNFDQKLHFPYLRLTFCTPTVAFRINRENQFGELYSSIGFAAETSAVISWQKGALNLGFNVLGFGLFILFQTDY